MSRDTEWVRWRKSTFEQILEVNWTERHHRIEDVEEVHRRNCRVSDLKESCTVDLRVFFSGLWTCENFWNERSTDDYRVIGFVRCTGLSLSYSLSFTYGPSHQVSPVGTWTDGVSDRGVLSAQEGEGSRSGPSLTDLYQDLIHSKIETVTTSDLWGLIGECPVVGVYDLCQNITKVT